MLNRKKTFETTCPRIYAYTTPDYHKNIGWLKIGYTATQTVEERVRQQLKYSRLDFVIEWWRRAPYDDENDKQLIDKDFHKFLIERYKIKRDADGLEWFKIDADTARKYLEEFCAGKSYRPLPPADSDDYTLRAEQNAAVEQTLEYWMQNPAPSEFLWNAKPRFGKNLAVYEFIKEYDAAKVLIVTNRPAIADSWYKDFLKFTAKNPARNYIFTSNTAKIGTPFDGKLADGQRLIAFISLQDLKSAESFGGKTKKLDWIKKGNFSWDILVVDESHEGVDTVKTAAAFENIARDFTLYLSGTPFRAIANEDFRTEQIYNWSYLQEQTAKRNFTAEPNPYADKPRMNLFSYRLSDMILDKISDGLILDGENLDYAFDLNEFFSTNGKGKFLHEADVKKFLDALTHNEKFPFSTTELRDELKHTFWLLHRVDSAKALAKLLNSHEIFSDYEIVVAAGDGKVDESDVTLNEKSLERVKKAIASHDKTITLSVGQLTTGVTVPEWTAVLMLSDIKSATLYMQAAFRAQNPCRVGDLQKTNCYVFDFNPARTLEIYSTFAQSICHGTGALEKIRELLNFFPALAEDANGKMVELDAEKIMSLPQILKVNQVVERGFMDNNLFNPDSIVHVFSATPKLVDILNKIPRDDSPDKKSTITINLDDSEVTPESVTKKTGKIFGEKVRQPRENIPASEAAREIADAVQKSYALTKAQTDALARKIDKNLDGDTSAENIARVQREVIEQLETKKADDARRKKDSEIRAHLRGFARTIPSFIMAFGDRNLTLKNFEQHIDAAVFLEVTSITLEEFQFLRDASIFNENVFDAAIQKFLDLKDELADYLAENHDKDIFCYIPPQNTRQIFTPRHAVIQMLDALERENPGIFDDPAQKFLDPYMKSGMFIVEIVKRLFRSAALKKIFPDDTARLTHILTRQVYGFAPTEIILRISTSYIFGSYKIPRSNFVRADISSAILAGTLDECLKKNFTIRVTVLNHDRVKKFGEVFTPKEIVDEMLDNPEIADVFQNLDAKILEPTAGTGAFLEGILQRKLKFAKTREEKFRALASIYAVELQLDNLDAAKDKMAKIFAASFQNFSSDDEISMRQILDANIIQGDILKAKNYHDEALAFTEWIIGAEIVKGEKIYYDNLGGFFSFFNFTVGNPPYQLDTKGDNKTYAAPIYHRFLEEFFSRCDRVLMIHPARCLFRAGGTPKKFIDRLLSDSHIKIIRYFPNASEVFENIDLKGGVAITYRDTNRFFGAVKVYIPFPELRAIFHKVTTRKDFKPLTEIMRGVGIFHYTEQLHVENPTAASRMSKTHEYDVKTNALENFPDIFLDDKPNDDREYIKMWGLVRMERVCKWIRRDYILDIPLLHVYKVMIPKAYGGAGALRENGPTMLVGLPLVGYTETFITLGAFDSAVEAESALKYVKTKFARALLGVLKVTQEATPPKWKYVPQQDFSAGSDVPWEKPVAQIDEYLYVKYGLSAAEIAFIEANVKAMD